MAQICWERAIKDTLYYKWREQFQRCASEIFVEGGRAQVEEAQAAHIAELERAVGRLTLENGEVRSERSQQRQQLQWQAQEAGAEFRWGTDSAGAAGPQRGI